MGGRSFFTKTRTIFIPIHRFFIFVHHEFKFLPRFCNKYSFCNILEFGNNQKFKPKHMFIIAEYHNFWWMIKVVFWNDFKIWMSVWNIRKEFENICKHYNFLKYLIYWRKMDMKSGKIIDSNLKNVKKALHVPKSNMCSKCKFALKQWNFLKNDMRPKSVFASKQWNVQHWHKESSRIENYPLIKL